MLQVLDKHRHGLDLDEFKEHGMRAIYSSFWQHLPQDHFFKWYASIVGEAEVDARFKAMLNYPGLCYFKKGISSISQCTGTEHKEMEEVF